MRNMILSVAFAISTFLNLNLAVANSDDDRVDLRECLQNWGKHPFRAKDFEYRVVKAGVRVFGIGKNAVDDAKETKHPELVLIKPSVNVFSNESAFSAFINAGVKFKDDYQSTDASLGFRWRW